MMKSYISDGEDEYEPTPRQQGLGDDDTDDADAGVDQDEREDKLGHHVDVKSGGKNNTTGKKKVLSDTQLSKMHPNCSACQWPT
jgi:hypothetical protein